MSSHSVSAVGARRRVQALFASGHTYMTIAAASGLGRQTVYKIANGSGDTLTAETVDKVIVGFAALSTVPGAHRRNIGDARLRNWAAPGMWDDIDDPNEVVDCSVDPDLVDEVLVHLFIRGEKTVSQLNDAEKDAAAQAMREIGVDPEQIAIRMHWNWKTNADRKAAA